MGRRLAPATILENREVARDTVVLRVSFPLVDRVRAGQFAMVHPLRDGCLLPRPLSILDSGPEHLDLLVKVVGRGTRALAALGPGDEIRVLAPLGRPFPHEALRGRPLLLVAGGVGLVPLHLLRRELLAEGHDRLRAFFGARHPLDLPRSLLGEDFELWVEEGAEPDCRVGLVTAGLAEALREWPDAVVATCGPTPMMRAVAEQCARRPEDLWLCLEEQMGCGAGVCRACVVPDAQGDRMRTVCKDGPVFRLDEIDFATHASGVRP